MGRLDDMRAAAAKSTGKPPVRPPMAPLEKKKKKSKTERLIEAKAIPEKHTRPWVTAEHIVKHKCGCSVGCKYYLETKCVPCEIKSKKARTARLRASRMARGRIKALYWIEYPMPAEAVKIIIFNGVRWEGSLKVPDVPFLFIADRRTERDCLFELHEKYATWAKESGIPPRPIPVCEPKPTEPAPVAEEPKP